MNKTLLQVRVMAYTPQPEDIPKLLPNLLQNLYPNDSLPQEITIDQIMQKLQNQEMENFGKLEKTLQDRINRVCTIYKEFETALANWEPSKATTLAISIEESLLQLEKYWTISEANDA